MFRVLKAEEEKYSQKVDEIEDSLIVSFDPFEMDYANFLNSIKTTDILFDWINEAAISISVVLHSFHTNSEERDNLCGKTN